MGLLSDYLMSQIAQGQQKRQYDGVLASLFNQQPQDQVNITPQISAAPPLLAAGQSPTPIPATATQPGQPMGGDNSQLALRAAQGAYNGPAAAPLSGPGADQFRSLASGLPPQIGLPLLLQAAQQQLGPKAPIQLGKDSRLVVSDGQGGYKVALDAAPEQLTPYQKGEQIQGDYNALDKGSDQIQTAMDAAPWQKQLGAFNAEQRKPQASAEVAAADEAARLPYKQQLADERNAEIDRRLADAAKIDLTDPGDKSYIESIANYKVRPPSAGRNPAQRKAIIEAALQLNPDYTEAKFDQSAKALRDFGTGKQGDIARSLDVSVAHLDTLRELGDALNNGNITILNAAKQRFAEEFGVPAPTNFDAAKAIVADEVAKGVIGGQSAQSDRETLAASLRRAGSPQDIEGAINTFQSLLKGQLNGLRSQYKRTTGAVDFDKAFLSDRTRSVLGNGDTSATPQAGSGTSKTINGVTYHRVNGQWMQ